MKQTRTTIQYVIAKSLTDAEYNIGCAGLSHSANKSAQKWLNKNRAVAPSLWKTEKIYKVVTSIQRCPGD